MVTPLREGQELVGESGGSYLTVSPLGNPRPGVTSNVWTAVDAETNQHVFILKQPAADDYFGSYGRAWPKFRSEMIMHELFKDCRYIRRQLDRIPPPKHSPEPPRLVLEPTECTLTDARKLRPLTDGEIKTIMKHVLLGLREIHSKGLVYAGKTYGLALPLAHIDVCLRFEDGQYLRQRLPRYRTGHCRRELSHRDDR